MNKAEQPQNVGYARSDACLGVPETVTQREGDNDVGKRRRRLGQTCHELWRDLVSHCGPRLSYQAYIEKAVTSGHDVGGVKEHYNRAPWSQPNVGIQPRIINVSNLPIPPATETGKDRGRSVGNDPPLQRTHRMREG